MKAIVCTKYGPPEVLQFQEVEKPAPRNNEVGIKIFATAVTASDCIIRGFKVSVLPWDMVDKSTSPLQPHFGPVFGDEAVQRGLLFPE